jgi:hypothetical protein
MRKMDTQNDTFTTRMICGSKRVDIPKARFRDIICNILVSFLGMFSIVTLARYHLFIDRSHLGGICSVILGASCDVHKLNNVVRHYQID